MTASAPTAPLIVLDDDPTGAQAVTGVPVHFQWSAASIAAAAKERPPAIHLLTNSRAYAPERAREIVHSAAAAATAALPEATILLRGDSTLRGHLLEEYEGVRDAVFPGQKPVLLLVPALPAAGRVTVGGVHFSERGDTRTPLHETEYARDGVFSYRDARLLQWAEDRSQGFFSRTAGLEVAPDKVGEALLELGRRGIAAVCAPDAETIGDLEAIADGLRRAWSQRAEVIVRCAPTFAGVLGGNLATEHIVPPRSQSVVVVCGSFVPTTTRQLRALLRAYPESLVEVDLDALASTTPEQELARAGRATQQALERTRLAVICTPRERQRRSFEEGEWIAVNLARVLRELDPLPEVVAAKGGITSAITIQAGVGARSARVLGPVADGVALWQATSARGELVHYLVFPGNVGDDDLLLEVIGGILGD